jgi:hypothetical protein
MTPDATKPATGDAAGSRNNLHKRHASEVSGNKLPACDIQAQNLVRRSSVRPPHLRLISPPPPPCARRIEVRISAFDGRFPLGRTRLLRLREPDFFRLIEAAKRLDEASR